MASQIWLIFFVTVTYSLIFRDTLAADSNDIKTYIVYMGDLPKGDLSVASLHSNMLQKVVGSRASTSLLRSYKRSFNGFAAKLTEDEKNRIARMEGVVSVFPSKIMELHTTRSWDFMGFPQDVKRAPLESDVIVGMLDTGAWPEADSFNDDGFGPPPSKWKGSCDSTNFTCNNKLIGAKYYRTDQRAVVGNLSARDTEGHGTHTASTVGGRAVNNASLFGFANGTARGGVPSARIAVYKICWPGGCSEADILAAFDDAIADGVDIISLSVGSPFASDYFEDSIAIGAFHSMKNGVLTSNSAGNSGPIPGSVANYSPWSLTVAASTIDRKFIAQIVLGNNVTYEGPAINTFEPAIHPIVYGSTCEPGSLDPTLVKNKIVVCASTAGPSTALEAGASGAVIVGDFGFEDLAFSWPLPATYLNDTDGSAVQSYMNSTTTPSASILKSIQPVDKAAPAVVSFSSRGPNPITSDILKPDLTAPGVDIIAAWSLDTTVTGEEGDTRVVPFNIISGTSMSCPHASGAAAYVKSFHPTWSPAAIKSALMTTAATMSPTKNLDVEFAYGSGHIDPLKAIDPGSSIVRTFNRTVTNVGASESTYQATVVAPSGLVVKVNPTSLAFKAVGQKQSFVVTVDATIGSTTLSGSLVWSDGVHNVTSLHLTYIVYMGDLPKTKSDFSVAAVHSNMLQQVIGSRASKSLLRSYKRSFNGFVAKLTEVEKNQLAQMDGVVSVFPSQNKKLHTTRSWDFMGFPQDVKRAPLESDVIVGMLDTGVWPESDSFKDDGFGAPPAKWKGSCASTNFTCNNKLIGAKYYLTEGSEAGDEEPSARDTEGHGTHTASTVAGRAVSNASMLGLGKGTARGGVPSARIAVYKICWPGGCSDADILAAFDDAIADGVDIISLSVGGSWPLDYFEDSIAIGAFHSMKNGILTSNSAGNDGPDAGSITNLSPWSLSVAASSIDRKFLTQIVLGNNMTYEGPTVNTFDGAFHPIVYGGSVPNTKKGFTSEDSRFCEQDSLDPTLVKDKIVVCEDFDGPSNALSSGASGVVVEGDFGYEDLAFSFVLPTTYLNSTEGSAVLSYINSTTTPSASILKSYEPVDKAAPTVVSFSSRGPNLITLDLLKPDLTAPGVDILAAWSMGTTVTGEEGDTRVVPYNVISGTSMSCPHAAGAAAYVKSFHPTWSPAAIKSALMTTAAPMSPIKNLDAEFAYGSGHIDPLKATDPAESTYMASVISPSGLSVKVDPGSLSFKTVGEKQSFVVTVGATIGSKTLSGSLVWSDGVHKVTSPIVAFLSQ
ncbi:hypothetical protein L1887_09207 [Cichorium endivia]|nr:hypothetical protein L1887_09207 [Cichorium endivia]